MITKLFPQGKRKALTFSYDDGVTQDKRLVEILNKHCLKGTFNINSGMFGTTGSRTINGRTIYRERFKPEEIKAVYEGHEVAVHSLNHPSIGAIPKELVHYELLKDKLNLEELVGYPVRGMAYPSGSHSPVVYEAMRQMGIEYGRTVPTHETFALPSNYYTWEGTCHHSNPRMMELLEKFAEEQPRHIWLFYVWGHSYEFDDGENWEIIENFCRAASGMNDVWFASNIEIVDYLNAYNSLKFSSKGTSVYNPSGTNIFINANGRTIEIKKGETIQIYTNDKFK